MNRMVKFLTYCTYVTILLSGTTVIFSIQLDLQEYPLSPIQEQLVSRCSFEEMFKAARILKVHGINKQALSLFQVCAYLRPQDWVVQWELGDMYGLYGDLPRLWKGMHYRWRSKEKFKQKLWQGESLAGKKILLVALWGLGDTLQYVRYAKVCKDHGATVILSVQKPLKKLMELQPYLDMVVTSCNQVVDYDYIAPLIHIPRILNTTITSIPVQEPYIRVQESLHNCWQQKMNNTQEFLIGICWKGQHRMDPQTNFRSIPLVALAPLTTIEGVRLISLQVGDGAQEINDVQFEVQTFDPPLDSYHGAFMDTAALIMNLDLVISVDTSVAHLAGALGAPVWVLLPYAAENRFFLQRNDSPWYPTMRLFRQTKLGIWTDVIEKVTGVLKKTAKEKIAAKRCINMCFSLMYE